MTVIINYPPVERATDDILSRKDAAPLKRSTVCVEITRFRAFPPVDAFC